MDAVVNKIIGHIKSRPDECSSNSDEVLYGMKVHVLKEIDNDWCYIRTHYNYEGYIKKDELIINDNLSNDYEKQKNAVCISAFADIVDKPEHSGREIITVTRGAHIVNCKSEYEDDKFTKVKLIDGREGYIRKHFLKELKEDYDKIDECELRQNIVNAAISYMGTQYRWGGKSPLGIDCSGLCSMAYMLNGIIIYRDAKIKEGFPIHEISFEKVKKGDLLFFENQVAMYIENEQYIHSATTNDMVMINSFNKSHYNYFKKLDNKLLKAGSIF